MFTMETAGTVRLFLLLRIAFIHSIVFGFQVPLCSAQNNDVFIPSPEVKTLESGTTTPTPLPVTERNLWGLRLWQVMGLAFLATIILITFCCCLCDCRIPKTGYDKDDEAKEDSDCSDIEQASQVLSRQPQRGQKPANGSIPSKNQQRTTGDYPGKVNKAFDNEGEIAPQNESWKGIQRVTLSRQP